MIEGFSHSADSRLAHRDARWEKALEVFLFTLVHIRAPRRRRSSGAPCGARRSSGSPSPAASTASTSRSSHCRRTLRSRCVCPGDQHEPLPAKSVVVTGRARHLCFCLTPMWYAWDQFDAYFGPDRVGALASRTLRPVLAAMARWDRATEARVHRVERDLRAKIADWRGLLSRNVAQARRAVAEAVLRGHFGRQAILRPASRHPRARVHTRRPGPLEHPGREVLVWRRRRPRARRGRQRCRII